MPHAIIDNYTGRLFTRLRKNWPPLNKKETARIEDSIQRFLAKIDDEGGIWQFDFNRRILPSLCEVGVVVEIRYGQNEHRERKIRQEGLEKQLLENLRGQLPRHTVALRLLPTRGAIFLR